MASDQSVSQKMLSRSGKFLNERCKTLMNIERGRAVQKKEDKFVVETIVLDPLQHGFVCGSVFLVYISLFDNLASNILLSGFFGRHPDDSPGITWSS